jgi:hypothetical protein
LQTLQFNLKILPLPTKDIQTERRGELIDLKTKKFILFHLVPREKSPTQSFYRDFGFKWGGNRNDCDILKRYMAGGCRICWAVTLIVTVAIFLAILIYAAIIIRTNPQQLKIPPDQEENLFRLTVGLICIFGLELFLSITATSLECLERPGRPAQVSRFVVWILLAFFQVPSTVMFAINFFLLLAACSQVDYNLGCTILLVFYAIPTLISLGFLIGSIIACVTARPKRIPDSKAEPLLGQAVQINTPV